MLKNKLEERNFLHKQMSMLTKEVVVSEADHAADSFEKLYRISIMSDLLLGLFLLVILHFGANTIKTLNQLFRRKS